VAGPGRKDELALLLSGWIFAPRVLGCESKAGVSCVRRGRRQRQLAGTYSTCGTRGLLAGRCGLGRPVRGGVGCLFAQRVVGSWAVAYLLVDVDDNIVAAVRHVWLGMSVGGLAGWRYVGALRVELRPDCA
jgi:hypothetical protein